MKKILTTILAGTLVAGAAFAADASVKLNYRARLDAFSLLNKDNGVTTATAPRYQNERNWMNWNGYGGNSNDTLDIQIKSDMFGARIITALNVNGGASPINKVKEFSGWMKFNAGPGTLKLDAGNWDDGFADGNYRVKKDADAQSVEGIDFEAFKLGSIFSGGRGISFVDNLTSSGATNLGGFASYAFDVTDGVNLNLTVGGVQASFDEYSKNSDDGEETTKVTWQSAFASRAQVKVKDVLNAELIYKINHTNDGPLYHTFGLYVMPQILDALTLNIGGAAEVYAGGYKKDANGNKEKGDYFDWGVDLRARYQVMDPLSITFFTNVSGTTYDKGRSTSKGIVGFDGSKGHAKSDWSAKVAMWNHLTGRYKVNDLLTVTLNVGLITPLSEADRATGDKISYNPEWRVTPGIQIFPEAAGKASLWAGVAISGTSWTNATGNDCSTIGVDIPVIFRVKW